MHAERYPLSGASRFRNSGHDIDVNALGRKECPLVAECKGRKNGGRVNGVYRRLENARQAERIRSEPPPLRAMGGIAALSRTRRGRTSLPIDEVCALPVAPLASDDRVLWLWVPSMLPANGIGARVIEAWGFSPRTILTWAKNKMGNGTWLRGQTEHCVMAARGNPVVTLTNQTTLLHTPKRGHSVKPVEFYDLVESLCSAPRYADLFSRYRHNDKWDCQGDESPLPPPDHLPDDGWPELPASLRRAAP